MNTVPVNAERAYQVEIGVDWRIALDDWVEGRDQVVVVQSSSFPIKTDYPSITIPDGEAGKSGSVLLKAWEELAQLKIGRRDLIVGIGGGATTDFAGFLAATWLRGVDWLAIPTTVAGMVDAAIGGKTAINSEHGKNLIGAFHSPVAVLIDLNFLKTLPERDFAAGLAEVVKCGFIADGKILELLQHKSLKDLMHDSQLQAELIHRAVSVKAEVVGADFKESFLREVLNYGHTLGHAIERHSKYALRHGEAVAIGMCFIAELSKLALQLDETVVAKHYEILRALKLPTSYDGTAWPELAELISLDKKNQRGEIRFVAIDAIGSCTRIENPEPALLQRAYERIAQ